MEALTYAACPPFKLVTLDGLSALYHRASGATHIVSEPAPQILAALGSDAMTLDQLFAKLGESFDVTESVAALAARLDELVSLGLVLRG